MISCQWILYRGWGGGNAIPLFHYHSELIVLSWHFQLVVLPSCLALYLSIPHLKKPVLHYGWFTHWINHLIHWLLLKLFWFFNNTLFLPYFQTMIKSRQSPSVSDKYMGGGDSLRQESTNKIPAFSYCGTIRAYKSSQGCDKCRLMHYASQMEFMGCVSWHSSLRLCFWTRFLLSFVIPLSYVILGPIKGQLYIRH